MSATLRRYDIDWIRVIAIGLLLVYHMGIGFQPWGVFIGFIQNEKPLGSIWPAMAMLNVWRIPLLFFVSGMGVYFALQKRSWKQLILERTRRILIPFLFGMVAIVPLHVLIWQKFYSQDTTFAPGPGHLWFLANIFIYVILLSPLFYYLKRNEHGRIARWLGNLFRNPPGLLVFTACFTLETVLLKPETFALFAMTWHGFLAGLLAFLFGFLGMFSGERFWRTLLRWRWPFLSMAVVLYIIRLKVFQLEAPGYLSAVESSFWIYAAFGFGYRYLNHPGRTLGYLSQAAYPVYILHMVFLYLGSALIMPLHIPAPMQFILVLAFTASGCFATYELLIRRTWFLRPLFGLKSDPTGPNLSFNRIRVMPDTLKTKNNRS